MKSLCFQDLGNSFPLRVHHDHHRDRRRHDRHRHDRHDHHVLHLHEEFQFQICLC